MTEYDWDQWDAVIRDSDRLTEIIKASSKNKEAKIKLTREQETKLCQEYRLGTWVVSEAGDIYFQHYSCNHYDICEKCRSWEAKQREAAVSNNVEKHKKEHPEAKKRVKLGVPEKDVEALEKRIKRHGGKFHSAEGKEPGTKDIIAVLEDDPKRDDQEMEDIYGIEELEYDYEASLTRQAERSANGNQKRMRGALLKKSTAPKQNEDTYRLRLPEFKVHPEHNKAVGKIAEECKPVFYEATDEKSHQWAIYEIANEFAGMLEAQGIEYDIGMRFRNVTNLSRRELNIRAICPVKSLDSNKEDNWTKDRSEAETPEVETSIEAFLVLELT